MTLLFRVIQAHTSTRLWQLQFSIVSPLINVKSLLIRKGGGVIHSTLGGYSTLSCLFMRYKTSLKSGFHCSFHSICLAQSSYESIAFSLPLYYTHNFSTSLSLFLFCSVPLSLSFSLTYSLSFSLFPSLPLSFSLSHSLSLSLFLFFPLHSKTCSFVLLALSAYLCQYSSLMPRTFSSLFQLYPVPSLSLDWFSITCMDTPVALYVCSSFWGNIVQNVLPHKIHKSRAKTCYRENNDKLQGTFLMKIV